MGASFNSHIIKAPTKDEAVAAAKAYQQQRQHEDGHGPYTGHLGTCGVGVDVLAQTFETAQAAQDYIQECHQKWDLPMLAKINAPEGTEQRWLLAGWCSS